MTTKKKDWEKELDEIQDGWKKHDEMNTCSICDSPKGHTDIKQFISSLLDKVRQETVEGIKKQIIKHLEKMSKQKRFSVMLEGNGDKKEALKQMKTFNVIYAHALSETIKYIRTLK